MILVCLCCIVLESDMRDMSNRCINRDYAPSPL